jgi:hypothetical protein
MLWVTQKLDIPIRNRTHLVSPVVRVDPQWSVCVCVCVCVCAFYFQGAGLTGDAANEFVLRHTTDLVISPQAERALFEEQWAGMLRIHMNVRMNVNIFDRTPPPPPVPPSPPLASSACVVLFCDSDAHRSVQNRLSAHFYLDCPPQVQDYLLVVHLCSCCFFLYCLHHFFVSPWSRLSFA